MFELKNVTHENLRKQLKRKFSTDTIWLLSAQLVLFGCGFLLNFIIAFHLGTASLGVFSQSLAVYTIVSILLAFGLNNTLLKKISEKQLSPEDENKLLTSNITAAFIVSALGSVLFISLATEISAYLNMVAIDKSILIPFYALPFFNVNKNYMAYFSGKRNQKKVALERILRWVLLLLFVAVVVFQGYGVTSVLYCFLFAEGLLFFYNIFAAREYLDFRFTRSQVNENFNFGLKTYPAELVSVMNANIDIVIVGFYLPLEQLGIYSFIIFFVKTLAIFPGLLMQNINPIVSELWTKGKIAELQSRISLVKKINLYVIAIQFVILMIAYKIVTGFIREEFAGTFGYFMICLAGYLIFALVYWSGGMLVMMGKNKENNSRTVIVLILCIALQVLLTSSFGLVGSCIAMFLCAVLNYLLLKIMINSVFKAKIL